MNSYILRCLFLLNLCLSTSCFGQTETDIISKDYRFHLNYKPQPGYGIFIGYKNSNKDDEGNIKTIYAFGITQTDSGWNPHNGEMYQNKSIALELNKIKGKMYFGFVGGIDRKFWVADLGIYVNYVSDFAGSRSLSLRPRFGFSLQHWFNLDVFAENEIYLVKANYDIIHYWDFGVQYTFGIIRHYRRNSNDR